MCKNLAFTPERHTLASPHFRFRHALHADQPAAHHSIAISKRRLTRRCIILAFEMRGIDEYMRGNRTTHPVGVSPSCGGLDGIRSGDNTFSYFP